MFHYRRHVDRGGGWSAAAQKDLDGDGLSSEIEAQLRTCDVWGDDQTQDVGVTGMTCRGFQNWVNGKVNTTSPGLCAGTSADDAPAATWPPKCWTARDSDNDGMQDGWEVFAVAFHCPTTPTGPLYDAGVCTAAGLHEDQTCPAGKWCATAELSALSGPDPAVYDIYVHTDAYGCDASSTACQTGHAGLPGLDHQVTAAQQQELPRMWTDEPGTCWDGTTTGCVDPRDLRYRVQMHAGPGPKWTPWELPNDVSGAEIAGGYHLANSFFNGRFRTAMRYGGLARFGLASHGSTTGTLGGGQASSDKRTFSWTNGVTSETNQRQRIRDVMSHEVGHLFGLGHQHKTGCDTAGGGGQCGTVATAIMTCVYGSGTIPCGSVVRHNPNVPSVMSYGYNLEAGMLSKRTTPPLDARVPGNENWQHQGGCSRLETRFSKGLHAPILETFLSEIQPRTWRTVMLAQDLYCYDGWNDGQNESPYAFFTPANPPCGGGNGWYGPYCDAALCYFNWNSSSGSAEGSSYAFDVSRGILPASPPVTQCAADQIDDRDEWGEIVALGKQRMTTRYHEAFRIYGDTYNGGAPGNWAAWTFDIDTTAQFDQATYPVDGCKVPTDCCPTCTECRYDLCPAQACRYGQSCHASGVCTCFDDDDCFSGRCGPDGLCATGWGACGCTGVPAVCNSNPSENCPDQHCKTWQSATYDPPAGGSSYNPMPPLESALLNGSTGHVRLAHGGDNPLLGVANRDSLEVVLEMRFDGFETGETEHVVVGTAQIGTSTGLRLSVVADNGARLYARVHSQPPVINPSPGSPGLDVGRWYRVRWNVHKGDEDHILDVIPMNVTDGSYGGSPTAQTCRWRAWPTGKEIDVSQSIWLGHDGGSDPAVRFRGRIDNVQISNYWPVVGNKPAACVVQP